MLLARRHLRRLVSFTMRHVTAPLHTQHSAKEYVFRLEQSAVRPTSRPIVRPDLDVLRGNSQAAAEARATLSVEVRARLRSRMTGPTLFPYFARLLMMPL